MDRNKNIKEGKQFNPSQKNIVLRLQKLFSRLENILSKFKNILSRLGNKLSKLENSFSARNKTVYTVL